MLLLSLGFILFIFAFLDKAFGFFQKKIIIFLFCSIFVVLGGIRWNTGTDWLPYYDGFMNSSNYYDAVLSPYSFEWGYGILNYIIFNLTNSYTVFLVFFTFLKVCIKYKFLTQKEFLGYSLLSLYLYFCYALGDIVSTRQLLAVSFTLYSTLFIVKRKFFIFLIFVFLATLIHKSAIIFIFSYYIYWLNIKREMLIGVFFSSLILSVIFSTFSVSNIYIPIISDLSIFSSYQDKIETYSELGSTVYGSIDSTSTNLLGYLKKIFIMLPFLFLRKEADTIHARLFNLIVFGSVIYFVFGSIASDFKRLGAYFDILEIIVYPYLIYTISNKKTRYILLFLFCLIMYFRMFSSVFTFWSLMDPFYTIFDSNSNRDMW